MTARTRHFGRAAAELGITQQAVSKRIARLEERLGAPLLVRTPGRVKLTEAGRRFLEPALRALAAGNEAMAAVRRTGQPLRLDVWGHLYEPARTVGQVLDAAPGLRVVVRHARDLPDLLIALERGETDVAFGRMPVTVPPTVSHRLVRLEPLDAVLSAHHPLAAAPSLTPRDLRDSTLWFPAAPDRVDYLATFADRFAIPARLAGPNLGLDHFVRHLRDDPSCFSLFPADTHLPADAGLRSIPVVDPTPQYPWSLVWTTRPHGLDALLTSFTDHAHTHRWLEHDPTHDWLPHKP